MNPQLTALNVSGFIAQLVEHRTGNLEITGSNPVEVLNFFYFYFQASLRNCINCVHCDDHFFIFTTLTRPAMSKLSLDFGFFYDVNQNLKNRYFLALTSLRTSQTKGHGL